MWLQSPCSFFCTVFYSRKNGGVGVKQESALLGGDLWFLAEEHGGAPYLASQTFHFHDFILTWNFQVQNNILKLHEL